MGSVGVAEIVGSDDAVELQETASTTAKKMAFACSPEPIAFIVMKSKLRCLLWLTIVLLAIQGILWSRPNIAAIRSSSELEALREIAHGYGMSVSSDLEAELLRSGPGPNRGTTKTYRVSTGSGEEASIAISSFLWLGWQEHRFERTLAIR